MKEIKIAQLEEHKFVTAPKAVFSCSTSNKILFQKKRTVCRGFQTLM